MAVKLNESYVPAQIAALSVCACPRLPATIPASAGEIVAGQVMGVRTADDLLLPVRRALITADALDNVRVVTVGAANVGKFKVGDTVAWRTLTDATAHDMGAVTAVGATTVTFTNVTGAAITANEAYLYVADGSETAMAILEYTVADSTEQQQVGAYVGGAFYLAELTGMDAVAIADLGARETLNGIIIVPC